jgi:hypothetical protein
MRRLPFKIRLYLLTILSIGSTSGADFVSEHTVRDLSLGSITIGTGSPISLAGYGNLSNQMFVGYRDKFSLKEMAVASFGGLYHSPWMSTVLSVFSAGYEYYRQTLVGLHAQKELSDNISFGLAIQSLSLSTITLEKNLWVLYPRLGVEYKAFSGVTFGMNIDNPVQVGSEGYRQLAARFRLTGGASLQIGELCLLAGEYELEEGGNSCLRLGAEYSLLPEFKFRTGMSTQPFAPTFGCGYSYKNWIIDVASEQHRYLGNSLSVGLSYRFKN